MRAGERQIGDGAPCFVAAEAGINHNGDLDLAHQMIDAAADAGVDAVKFQNYRTEDFVSDRDSVYEYRASGQVVREPQYNLFKRCELEPNVLVQLREHCDSRRVAFFTTPTSPDGLGELVAAGGQLVKNGSDFLGHLELIGAMAESGLPTVLSVGMATEEEIAAAVAAYRQAGGNDLVLLHCTSAYPAPPDEVNLRRLPELAARFGCETGLSDHTIGTVAATAAVALGASVVEKHFTLDTSLPGPDHEFSADPPMMRALVEAVRTVERQLGDSVIGPTPSELRGRDEFRLSCVAASDLDSGRTLAAGDVALGRPGTGLPPVAAGELAGRVLRRALRSGEVVREADLEPL